MKRSKFYCQALSLQSLIAAVHTVKLIEEVVVLVAMKNCKNKFIGFGYLTKN